MKTVTFFNPKGGVGKSLHATMFASFLAYHEGARVLVFDGENEPRLFKDRQKDEQMMSDPDSFLSRYMAKNPVSVPYYEIRRLAERTTEYSRSFAEKVTYEQIGFVDSEEAVGKYDYVIYDFPAVAMDYTPAYALMCSGIFDLILIPVDTNRTTWSEAIGYGGSLQKRGVKPVLFWNRVTADELSMKGPDGKGLLDGLSSVFESAGFEVMPQKVRAFAKAGRDADQRIFVKSTVCWPYRYVELNCPSLIDFYRAVKERLDRE